MKGKLTSANGRVSPRGKTTRGKARAKPAIATRQQALPTPQPPSPPPPDAHPDGFVVTATSEGVLLLNRAGVILDGNPQAARLLGRKRHQLLGQNLQAPLWHAVREDGRPFPVAAHPARVVLRTGQSGGPVVLGLARPRGGRRWLRVQAHAWAGAAKPQGVVVTLAEITPERPTDLAPEQPSDRYCDLYENAPDMFLSVDAATARVIQCNQTYLNATGHTRAETIGRPVHELYHPAAQADAHRAFQQFRATGEVRNLELILKRRDGSPLPVSLNVSAVRDARGRLRHSRSILRDITHQKRVEELLRKSEERFRAIAAHTPDLITMQDRKLRYELVINPQLGLTESDILGKQDQDLFSKDEARRLSAIKKQVLATGKSVHVTMPFSNRQGGLEFFEGDYIPRLDAAGTVNGLIGYFRNVTESQRDREALRESSQFKQQIIASAKVGIVVNDRELKHLVWNPFMEDLTGMPAADVLGKHPAEVFPFLQSAGILEQMNRALKGEIMAPADFQFQIPQTGRSGWVSNSSSPLRNIRGEIIGIIGIVRDITERKRLEAARLETLARFSGFSEASQYGMGMADLAGHILFANSTLAGMIGEKSAAACVGKHFPSTYYSPAMARKIQKEVIPAVMRDGHWQGELEIVTAAGVRRPTEENYFLIRDEQGQPQHLADIMTDITERKRVETALRQSEERHRLLFTSSRDALITLEPPRWQITACNSAAVEIFCTKQARHLLGNHPARLSPKRQPNGQRSRPLAQAMIKTALQAGSHAFEWRHRRLDGEEFPAEVLLTRMELGGRQLLQATVRDISERVRHEQEILSISERERQHLAHDLHDGLGQLLVGAGYLANTLRLDLVGKSPTEAQRLDRIEALLNEAIGQARDLARGVQPVSPEPNGLMAALEKLAAQTRHRFGINCIFQCRQPIFITDNRVANHLFRIAQEAVTNAIKHSRTKRIHIRLSRRAGRIELAVNDDGVGLPARPGKPAGLGLDIMRHRANLINGGLDIQPGARGGTCIRCRLPQLK